VRSMPPRIPRTQVWAPIPRWIAALAIAIIATATAGGSLVLPTRPRYPPCPLCSSALCLLSGIPLGSGRIRSLQGRPAPALLAGLAWRSPPFAMFGLALITPGRMEILAGPTEAPVRSPISAEPAVCCKRLDTVKVIAATR